MATWLVAGAGLLFKPRLKVQPARPVLRSYTITSWETEDREGKRSVRSLSCLNTRLPGKDADTPSDGTKDLWVKNSISSFAPHRLIHELPFFNTTLKKLSLYPSLSIPFIPFSGPDSWSPFPLPVSQLSKTTANVGWWPDGTLTLELVLTKGLRFQAVSILVCK